MDTLLDEEILLFVLSPLTSNHASLRRIMKVQFGHFMIKTTKEMSQMAASTASSWVSTL